MTFQAAASPGPVWGQCDPKPFSTQWRIISCARSVAE